MSRTTLSLSSFTFYLLTTWCGANAKAKTDSEESTAATWLWFTATHEAPGCRPSSGPHRPVMGTNWHSIAAVAPDGSGQA